MSSLRAPGSSCCQPDRFSLLRRHFLRCHSGTRNISVHQTSWVNEWCEPEKFHDYLRGSNKKQMPTYTNVRRSYLWPSNSRKFEYLCKYAHDHRARIWNFLEATVASCLTIIQIVTKYYSSSLSWWEAHLANPPFHPLWLFSIARDTKPIFGWRPKNIFHQLLQHVLSKQQTHLRSEQDFFWATLLVAVATCCRTLAAAPNMFLSVQ